MCLHHTSSRKEHTLWQPRLPQWHRWLILKQDAGEASCRGSTSLTARQQGGEAQLCPAGPRIQQEDSVSLPHVTCPPASRAEELAASQIPLVLSSATKVL